MTNVELVWIWIHILLAQFVSSAGSIVMRAEYDAGMSIGLGILGNIHRGGLYFPFLQMIRVWL